jgi:hypothetical protein
LSSEAQPKAVIATPASQPSTKPDAKLPPVTSSHVTTKDQLSAAANAAAVTDASTAEVTRSPQEDKTAAGPIARPVRKGTYSERILLTTLTVISFLFLFLFSSIEGLFLFVSNIS